LLRVRVVRVDQRLRSAHLIKALPRPVHEIRPGPYKFDSRPSRVQVTSDSRPRDPARALLFERMLGLPQERAIIFDVNTIEWTGDRIMHPIRLNPYIKEGNESLRNSSATVVCWHIDATNLQRHILNHGPARPGPPRVSESAFHPVQPRPCRRPSPNSIRVPSSRVTAVPVQRSAGSGHPSPSPPSARVHYSRSTAGTLDVRCMCIRVVSNPPA
jgi:hypothetical protein